VWGVGNETGRGNWEGLLGFYFYFFFLLVFMKGFNLIYGRWRGGKRIDQL
jgi:hypothetical protein